MSEHIQETSTEEKPEAGQKTVTIKIPRINIQTTVLALIALVTILQTAQLYGLKASAKNITVKPASAASTAAQAAGSGSAAGGSSAELPEMVGGC